MEVSWINRFELKKGKWIYEPSRTARENGIRIVNRIESIWDKPEYFYHFKNGGHVQAIKASVHNDFFAVLDIKAFFSSISRTRVTRTLKGYLGYEDARNIAKESTIKNIESNKHSHSLPYGFIQSPILASICLNKSSLGLEMNRCSETKDISIAVYVDDIILSSKSQKSLDTWVERLKAAAVKSKFTLVADKKTRNARSAVAFNIIFSKQTLQITPERFHEFKDTYIKSESEKQRHGIASYIATVNISQATSLNT